MRDELNRRNFIEDSGFLAASTAGIATWPALHPAVRTARGEAVAPSETIRVALIGRGGQGSYSSKLGRKIFWDAPSETVVDQKGHPDAEANTLLGREYRKGYELPKVEPA